MVLIALARACVAFSLWFEVCEQNRGWKFVCILVRRSRPLVVSLSPAGRTEDTWCGFDHAGAR